MEGAELGGTRRNAPSHESPWHPGARSHAGDADSDIGALPALPAFAPHESYGCVCTAFSLRLVHVVYPLLFHHATLRTRITQSKIIVRRENGPERTESLAQGGDTPAAAAGGRGGLAAGAGAGTATAGLG